MQKAAENAAVHLPMAAPFFSMHFAMRPGISWHALLQTDKKTGFRGTNRVTNEPSPFAQLRFGRMLALAPTAYALLPEELACLDQLPSAGIEGRIGELEFFDVQSSTNAQPQCTQVPAASVLLQAPLKCLLPSFTIANSDAPDVKANAASRRQARNFVDYPPTHTRLNPVRVFFFDFLQ